MRIHMVQGLTSRHEQGVAPVTTPFAFGVGPLQAMLKVDGLEVASEFRFGVRARLCFTFTGRVHLSISVLNF